MHERYRCERFIEMVICESDRYFITSVYVCLLVAVASLMPLSTVWILKGTYSTFDVKGEACRRLYHSDCYRIKYGFAKH